MLKITTRWAHGRAAAFLLLLALVAPMLSGCVGVSHLRDAQDRFAQATAAEQALKAHGVNLSDDTSGVLTPDDAAEINRVRTLYGATLQSLKQLTESEKGALKEQQLWGDVLTLQTLSNWKLANYDAALKAAQEAESEAVAIGTRDAVVVSATPSLIRNDQAYRFIYAPAESEAVRQDRRREADALLLQAITDFERLRSGLPKVSGINVTLIRWTLAAYVNILAADMRPREDPLACTAHRALTDLDAMKAKVETAAWAREIGWTAKQLSADVKNWRRWTGRRPGNEHRPSWCSSL